MLLSICVPSYNRGHRAQELIQKLLRMPYDKTQIEIICSNNGSDKNIEGYEELRKIRDKRFVYHEFSSNQGFAGNVNQVIKMSRGDFCMLLSDEDAIIEENLYNYLRFLELHPELSLVKGCTSLAYSDLKTQYISQREEALDSFYMMGNYISGTIYNRSVISDEVIVHYATQYEGNEAYYYYVHLFLDAYALLHGNFCSSDLLLIAEGIPADHFDLAPNSPNQSVPVFGTYESRLKQMQGFIEQIKDFDTEATVKFQMFVRVLERIAEQINVQKKRYVDSGYNWSEIMSLTAEQMKEEISFLELPFGEEDVEIINQFIDSITINWEG